MNLFIRILSAGLLLSAGRAGAVATARELSDAFAEVARRASPAVVNIQVTQERRVRPSPHEFFFGDPENLEELFPGRPDRPPEFRWRTKGVGSGVVIDPEGVVLTNEHVVRDADEIEVTLTKPDGKQQRLPGRVVATDPGLDLAVVRIQAKGPFPHLKLADSSRVRVGDWVVAIGSPFELQQTVTVGIVSAVRQALMIEGRRYPNMIQTDAAINRGNSGGPLLSLDAEIVAINTAIFSPSGAFAGIGFAVPADEIKQVLDLLLAGRRPQRGWIGISVMGVDAVIQKRFDLPDTKGALVNSVFDGSPAERAGLKRGDVIVRFDGQAIGTPDELIRLASRAAPEKTVQIDVIRGGRRELLKLRLADRPEWVERGEAPPGAGAEPPAPKKTADWQGVVVAPSGSGVLVREVRKDSKLAGYLSEGDLIQGVDQAPVRTLADFERATRSASLKEGVVFDVIRDGQSMFISVQEQ